MPISRKRWEEILEGQRVVHERAQTDQGTGYSTVVNPNIANKLRAAHAVSEEENIPTSAENRKKAERLFKHGSEAAKENYYDRLEEKSDKKFQKKMSEYEEKFSQYGDMSYDDALYQIKEDDAYTNAIQKNKRKADRYESMGGQDRDAYEAELNKETDAVFARRKADKEYAYSYTNQTRDDMQLEMENLQKQYDAETDENKKYAIQQQMNRATKYDESLMSADDVQAKIDEYQKIVDDYETKYPNGELQAKSTLVSDEDREAYKNAKKNLNHYKDLLNSATVNEWDDDVYALEPDDMQAFSIVYQYEKQSESDALMGVESFNDPYRKNLDEQYATAYNFLKQKYTDDEIAEMSKKFTYVADRDVAYQTTQDVVKDIADKTGAEKLPYIIGLGFGTAVDAWNAPFKMLDGLAQSLTGEPINVYNSRFSIAIMNDAIKQGLIQQSANQKAASMALSVYCSLAQMVSTMGAGVATGVKGISLFLMGNSAASQTMKEMAEKGASNDKIIASSIATGIAEAFFEHFSLEGWLHPEDLLGSAIIQKSLSDTVKAMLTQWGCEISEEICTDIANEVSDYIINGGNSNTAMTIEAYKNMGYSQKQAESMYLSDFGEQLAETALTSAIISALMSPSSIIATDAKIAQKVNTAIDVSGATQGFIMSKAVEYVNSGQSEADGNDIIDFAFKNATADILKHKAVVSQELEDTYTKANDSDFLSNKMNLKPEELETIANYASSRGASIQFAQFNEQGQLVDNSGKVIKNFETANGIYDDNRTIYLNPKMPANRLVSDITGHEVGHDMQGTKAYDNLKGKILDALKENNEKRGRYTKSQYDWLINDARNAYKGIYGRNVSTEALENEIVNDYIGANYGSITVLNAISQNPERMQTLWGRLLNSISDFLGKEQNTGFENLKKYYADGMQAYNLLPYVSKAYNAEYRGNAQGARFSNNENIVQKDMSEHDRAKILSESTVPVFEIKPSDSVSQDYNKLNNDRFKEVILERFKDLFDREYHNEDIKIDFQFSKTSARESMRHLNEKNAFERIMSNLDEIASTAVPVKIHSDRYEGLVYEKGDVETMYVLFGGDVFTENGNEFIIPVKLEIKEYRSNPNNLYIYVDADIIKAGEIAYGETDGNESSSAPHGHSYRNYSLTDILPFVNRGSFVKYFPDKLLSEEQIQVKNRAIKDEYKHTRNKFFENDNNIKDYNAAVASGNKYAAQRVTDRLARIWAGDNGIKYSTVSPIITEEVNSETGEVETFVDGVKLSDADAVNYSEDGLIPLYRSNDVGNVFNHGNKGVFFTTSKHVAEAFGSMIKGREKTVKMYGKAENPLILNAKGNIYTAIPVDDSMPSWLQGIGNTDVVWDEEQRDYVESAPTVDLDNIVEEAFSRGYDAVIVDNVREGVGGGVATDVVLKSSEQARLADPITYDDKGNMIPITERFTLDENNPNYKDVRYSTGNNLINPTNSSAQSEEFFNTLKEKQLDIVLENNPANDDYHTWIRTVDDILTFQEAFDEWEADGYSQFTEDFTNEDMQKALSEGKITVYSSYPIKDGIFVSPSRMEAWGYSGTGKVYSKTVPLEDVAWIDVGQGQYAPQSKLGQSSSELKFSIGENTVQTELDKQYMDAVNKGDMGTAQQIIDEESNDYLNSLLLPNDDDIEGFKFHKGSAPKHTMKRYAVFNVSEDGFKAAYAGNKVATPVGVWLDAVNLQSYVSDITQFDDGTFASYIIGDTGANAKQKFSEQKLTEYGIKPSSRLLLERGGKHSSDVPNFSQMNLKQDENGNKVTSPKDGALPHNKLIFEIEYGYDEDLTDYVKEHGRISNGRNQGLAKIYPNQYYDFKTNPNAVGNWGIGGTFRITRLVPYSEVVEKTAEYKANAVQEAKDMYANGEISKADMNKRIAGADAITLQKWVGGYHPEEFGLTVEGVDEMYRNGQKMKLTDAITRDDNGKIILPSQRFNAEIADPRYQLNYKGSDKSFGEARERSRRIQEDYFNPQPEAPQETPQETNQTPQSIQTDVDIKNEILADVGDLDDLIEHPVRVGGVPDPLIHNEPKLTKKETLQKKMQDFRGSVKKGAEFLATKFADSAYIIHDVSVKHNTNTYKWFTNGKSAPSMANNAIGGFTLKDGKPQFIGNMIDMTGKVVGKSVAEILYPYNHADSEFLEAHKVSEEEHMNQCQEYLVMLLNRDEINMNGRPRINLSTNQDIRRIAKVGNMSYEDAKNQLVLQETQSRIDKFEKEYGKDYANKLIEANHTICNYWLSLNVQSGQLTQKEAEAWLKAHPNYVPTIRHDGTDDSADFSAGKQGVFGEQRKRATGGGRQLIPLEDAYRQKINSAMKFGQRNVFFSYLLSDAEKYSELGDHMRVLATVKSAENMTQGQILGDYNGRANTYVAFTKDGGAVVFEVDGTLNTAIKDLTNPKLEVEQYLEAWQDVNTLWRGLVTTKNPLFTVSNAFRDAGQAMLMSESVGQYWKDYKRAYQEMKADSELYKQFMASGVMSSSISEGLREAQKDNFFSKLEGIGEMVEMLPRFSAYLTQIEKYGNTYEGRLNAQFAAKDITTNFSQGGDWTRMLNRNGFNFLNANVQGLLQIGRKITDPLKNQSLNRNQKLQALGGFAIRMTALGFAPYVVNAMMMALNPDRKRDYDELSDSIKTQYLLFPASDGVFIRIPYGRALVISTTLANLAQNAIEGKKIDVGESLKTIWDNVGVAKPSGLWTPVVDAHNNKTWYGGTLVNYTLAQREKEEQYDESTDEISKALGKLFNISPKKVNYVLDQWSGFIGDFVLPAFTHKYQSDNPLTYLTNPIVKRFTTDAVSNNDLYDTYNDMFTEVKKQAATDGSYYGAEQYFYSQSKEINSIWTQIHEVQRYKSLSQEEKDALQQKYMSYGSLDTYKVRQQIIRDMRKAINGIQRNTIENYDYIIDASSKYPITDDMTFSQKKTQTFKMNNDLFGSEYALQTYGGDTWDNAQLANTCGIDFESYAEYFANTVDLRADKDENGNTISGTLKKKKWEALSSMNLSEGQRAFLFAMEYKISQKTNYYDSKALQKALNDYINTLPLSTEEKKYLKDNLK